MNRPTSTVVALLLLASMGAAQAAIGPVTIVDGNYQQSTSTTSVTPPKPAPCPAASNCYFLFSPVPAGKQLIVTHVSCNIIANGGAPYWAYITVLSGGAPILREQHLVPVELISGAYAISNSTLQLFNSQERPVINVGPGALTGRCTIAGQIKNAP